MDVFDISVKDILNEHLESNAQEIDNEALKVLKTESAARKKQKPRLKLDAERLLGKMGLSEIEEILKGFTFKGKGHEATDIIKLMEKYELWSQQMISNMNFSDCIEKIEDLGHKKVVKNTIKRFRAGLGLDGLSSEYVNDDHRSDHENVEDIPQNTETIEMIMKDFDFDDIEQEYFNMDNSESEPQPPSINSQLLATSTNTVTPTQLSEEKLQQIEENRKRALERLKSTRERNALN